MLKGTQKVELKSTYDISDLDPIMVIQALFNNALQQGWGLVAVLKETLSKDEAAQIYHAHIKSTRFIDWEYGRPLKISLLNLKNVDVEAYDRANGQGRAKATFDAIRNGSTHSDLPNDSADAVQEYQNNIPYMKEILNRIVSCDGEIHRHAIEQTEVSRACLTAFNSQFNAAVSTKKDKLTQFEYFSRINELSNAAFAACVKTQNDKALIESAIADGKYIYCESKSQPMNPGRNQIYICNSYNGVKQCTDELKELDSSYQLYISSTKLQKKLALHI